jgi:hypothetical protein
MPRPRREEFVAAAVVLRPGLTVAPIEPREFLGEQLDELNVPRRIYILD